MRRTLAAALLVALVGGALAAYDRAGAFSARELLLQAPFTPARIPGLAAWHDASRASSVTLNAADVSQIDDLSGNARHASQGTAGNQPLYSLGGLNGRNSILYTAANSDFLSLASATTMFASVPGATWAGVVNITSLAATSRVFSAGNRINLNISTAGNPQAITRRLDTDTNAASNSTTPTIVAGTTHFLAAVVDYGAGTVTFYVDGASQSIAATWAGGNGISDSAAQTAPRSGTSGATTFGGHLPEGAMYPSVLSAAQVAQLRRYVRAKWGTP